MAFDEDRRLIRDRRSAANFALLSRIALMMLKRHGAPLREPAFLAQVLAGVTVA